MNLFDRQKRKDLEWMQKLLSAAMGRLGRGLHLMGEIERFQTQHTCDMKKKANKLER